MTPEQRCQLAVRARELAGEMLAHAQELLELAAWLEEPGISPAPAAGQAELRGQALLEHLDDRDPCGG